MVKTQKHGVKVEMVWGSGLPQGEPVDFTFCLPHPLGIRMENFQVSPLSSGMKTE